MRKHYYFSLAASLLLAGCVESPTGPESDNAPGNPVLPDGIWISRDEIMQLPTSGPAWEQVLHAANRDEGTPDVSDQDQRNNIDVLAKAFVYVRTGDERYRDEVRANCIAAIDTELGGRTLALGRELLAYIVAAELVGLTRGEDIVFRLWLRRCLTETLDGKTLQSTHEIRPNNWGTVAGATRAAIAIYTNDQPELERTAQVFKGWLGDRETYAGFRYGDLSWQADPDRPVGINPHGSFRDGFDISGALPDDMRRGGSFGFLPAKRTTRGRPFRASLRKQRSSTDRATTSMRGRTSPSRERSRSFGAWTLCSRGATGGPMGTTSGSSGSSMPATEPRSRRTSRPSLARTWAGRIGLTGHSPRTEGSRFCRRNW